MAIDRLKPIIIAAVDKLKSTAAASGYFRGGVTSYELKSAPNDLAFATWIVDIKPIAPGSGLNVTSVRLPMMCRIYRNMLADPQDDIDTELSVASSYLLAELTGDFGIGGTYVDLLGAHGDPLGTDLGYIELDDSVFRVADTTVPFIAHDVFDQEE